jgi:hypothetical protein
MSPEDLAYVESVRTRLYFVAAFTFGLAVGAFGVAVGSIRSLK